MKHQLLRQQESTALPKARDEVQTVLFSDNSRMAPRKVVNK